MKTFIKGAFLHPVIHVYKFNPEIWSSWSILWVQGDVLHVRAGDCVKVVPAWGSMSLARTSEISTLICDWSVPWHAKKLPLINVLILLLFLANWIVAMPPFKKLLSTFWTLDGVIVASLLCLSHRINQDNDCLVWKILSEGWKHRVPRDQVDATTLSQSRQW